MENLKWRRGARITAWIHVIFTALALVWLIVTATLLTIDAFVGDDSGPIKSTVRTAVKDYLNKTATATATTSNRTGKSFYEVVFQDPGTGTDSTKEYDLKVEDGVNMVIMILWIRTVILIICSLIQFYAAIKLLSATSITAVEKDSLRNCRIWMVVTVIMLVLTVANNIYAKDYIYLPIGIIVTGIFMFVVFAFMEEVRHSMTQK